MNNAKQYGEVKQKLNEVIKNQKITAKISSLLNELHKSSSSDAQTISQLNTAVQGLKVSNSAHEAKFVNALKEIKELSLKNGDAVSELAVENVDKFKELKTFISGRLKQTDESVLKALKKSMANAIPNGDELSMSRLIGQMEQKLTENAVKDKKAIIQEIGKMTGKMTLTSNKKSKQQSAVSSTDELDEKGPLGKVLTFSYDILNGVEFLKQLKTSEDNMLQELAPKIGQILNQVNKSQSSQ